MSKDCDEPLTLQLFSPVGGQPLLYNWSTIKAKEGLEIFHVVRVVSEEFPQMQYSLRDKVLARFDLKQYNSVKNLCAFFNRTITRMRGLENTNAPNSIRSTVSIPLLKFILQQVYREAVNEPQKLTRYEPFSSQVYGETSFDLINQIISNVGITENDVFIDLGSGIGQVVLQVAALTPCKTLWGIEKGKIPSEFSKKMDVSFRKWMAWFGKSYGSYKLIKGDFLCEKYKSIITSASVIFVNNFSFGPETDHKLKLLFSDLKDGSRIISSKAFSSLNFRITTRNLTDIGTIMNVSKMESFRESVSWTGKPVPYYLQVIDRTKLERHFQKMKMSRSVTRSMKIDKRKFTDIFDNPTNKCNLLQEKRFLRSGREITAKPLRKRQRKMIKLNDINSENENSDLSPIGQSLNEECEQETFSDSVSFSETEIDNQNMLSDSFSDINSSFIENDTSVISDESIKMNCNKETQSDLNCSETLGKKDETLKTKPKQIEGSKSCGDQNKNNEGLSLGMYNNKENEEAVLKRSLSEESIDVVNICDSSESQTVKDEKIETRVLKVTDHNAIVHEGKNNGSNFNSNDIFGESEFESYQQNVNLPSPFFQTPTGIVIIPEHRITENSYGGCSSNPVYGHQQIYPDQNAKYFPTNVYPTSFASNHRLGVNEQTDSTRFLYSSSQFSSQHPAGSFSESQDHLQNLNRSNLQTISENSHWERKCEKIILTGKQEEALDLSFTPGQIPFPQNLNGETHYAKNIQYRPLDLSNSTQNLCRETRNQNNMSDNPFDFNYLKNEGDLPKNVSTRNPHEGNAQSYNQTSTQINEPEPIFYNERRGQNVPTSYSCPQPCNVVQMVADLAEQQVSNRKDFLPYNNPLNNTVNAGNYKTDPFDAHLEDSPVNANRAENEDTSTVPFLEKTLNDLSQIKTKELSNTSDTLSADSPDMNLEDSSDSYFLDCPLNEEVVITQGNFENLKEESLETQTKKLENMTSDSTLEGSSDSSEDLKFENHEKILLYYRLDEETENPPGIFEDFEKEPSDIYTEENSYMSRGLNEEHKKNSSGTLLEETSDLSKSLKPETEEHFILDLHLVEEIQTPNSPATFEDPEHNSSETLLEEIAASSMVLGMKSDKNLEEAHDSSKSSKIETDPNSSNLHKNVDLENNSPDTFLGVEFKKGPSKVVAEEKRDSSCISVSVHENDSSDKVKKSPTVFSQTEMDEFDLNALQNDNQMSAEILPFDSSHTSDNFEPNQTSNMDTCKAVIMEQIIYEKQKNINLKAKKEAMENSIQVLQAEGKQSIESRLDELDITDHSVDGLYSHAHLLIHQHVDLQRKVKELNEEISNIENQTSELIVERLLEIIEIGTDVGLAIEVKITSK